MQATTVTFEATPELVAAIHGAEAATGKPFDDIGFWDMPSEVAGNLAEALLRAPWIAEES